MTRAIDIASLERRTGKAWRHWLAHLEKIVHLPHSEIARRLREECGVSGWWAQSIAVAYEQQIGRRVPGQQCDGGFQVSVSKTFLGSMDTVLARWQAAMEGGGQFAAIFITRGPEVSRTDKWRYWRCALADGSRVSVGIGDGRGARRC
jgi:hypothetical protein